MKKRLISIIALVLATVMALSACGSADIGVDPETGNIVINGVDTGVSSLGAKGEKGDKGDKGDAGDAATLVSFEKASSEGNIDIYKLTFSDGTVTELKIPNGKNGAAGAPGAAGAAGADGQAIVVVEIKKTASKDGVDTYTALLSDGTNYSFNVTNGANGEKGDTGDKGAVGDNGANLSVDSFTKIGSEGTVDIYELKFSDGSSTTVSIANGAKGEEGDKGQSGAVGDDLTVESFELVSDDGETVVYRLEFSNGEGKDITLYHGAKGDAGDVGGKGEAGVSITSIELTNDGEFVDEYTITYSDNSTSTFTVGTKDDASVTIQNVTVYMEDDDKVDFRINYSDGTFEPFTLIKTGDAPSEIFAAYELVKAENEGLELSKFVEDCVMSAKNEVVTAGSIIGVKTFGKAVGTMLHSYNTYFSTVTEEIVVSKTELTLNSGYFTTKHNDSTSYVYNSPVAVQPGTTIRIEREDGFIHGIRFLYGTTNPIGTYWEIVTHRSSVPQSWVIDDPCPYYTNAKPLGGGNFGEESGTTTCPDLVVLTWTKRGDSGNKKTYLIATKLETSVKVNLGELDAVAILRIAYANEDGEQSDALYPSYVTQGEANVIISSVLGKESVGGKVDAVADGTALRLTETGDDGSFATAKYSLVSNQVISFACELDALGEGGQIIVAHGNLPTVDGNGAYVGGAEGSCWIVVKNGTAQVFNYSTLNQAPSVVTINHGLTVTDFLKVTVERNYGNVANIRISTRAGGYREADVSWCASRGDVFAKPEGMDLTNVSLRWSLESLQEKVWVFGDYLAGNAKNDWTYYLNAKKYTKNAIFANNGMKAETALADLKWALGVGYTPQYVVWGVGMNDADSEGAVNAGWKNATEEFLDICEEKGITPILMTLPTTATKLHAYKNAWIKAWAAEKGERYIDAAGALGKESDTGYSWYSGHLATNGEDLTDFGAETVLVQVLIDFPEIGDNE